MSFRTFLCSTFGHKWDCSHVLDKDQRGVLQWVYIDHVCLRCWKTEYRFPKPTEVPTSLTPDGCQEKS